MLKEKFKTEIDYFRKEINGYMKVLFVEEFSEEGLMPKMKKRILYLITINPSVIWLERFFALKRQMKLKK